MDNVNLTDPILSRFDILCVIKDEVDKDLDHKLVFLYIYLFLLMLFYSKGWVCY